MAVTTTPWGLAVDRILSDGEWHSSEEIIASAGASVPPGVAYREGERRRGSVAPRVRGDQESALAAGARSRVRDALHSRVRTGTVERDGDRYRRRSP